jgi:hypothetical protein
MFDALRAGKPAPVRPDQSGHTTIEHGGTAPLCYIPDDLVHSFAFGFSVRTRDAGALASVHTGERFAVLYLDGDGRLLYRAAGGQQIEAPGDIADGRWHDIVLSHRYLKEKTEIFVDGVPAAGIVEQIEPRQFVLGGAGDDTTAPPERADYRDWLVYRAALNIEEANYLHDGGLFTASLEVYAPLTNVKLDTNQLTDNLAWSTSRVMVKPSDTAAGLSALESNIKAANVARQNEFVAVEKTVVAVAPDVLATYAGRYEIAPGNIVTIENDGARLFVNANGDRVPLYAESTAKFFIKTVGEITLEFVKDADGAVNTINVSMHGQEIPAKRLED